MSAAPGLECGLECGKDTDVTSVPSKAADLTGKTLEVTGIEDKEEFDPAASVIKSYCEQITEEEFEEQAASETEKALEGLMDYLDHHTSYYMDLLKKRKRQDLESGGVMSFLKVKVMDMIHGENSPLVRVTEEECARNMDNLKNNMTKVFDYALESKGKRVSKRLAEKRKKRNLLPNGTPTRSMTSSPKKPPRKGRPEQMPPPPPPPPPPVPSTPTTGSKVQGRRPLTPLQDRLNIQIVTPQSVQKLRKTAINDSLESLAPVDTSLSSLHKELLSSNPWKRLKCVSEDKSPGGTPVAKKKLIKTPGPDEPIYKSLLSNIQDKFKNARSPSPDGKLFNNAISPASALSPFE